MPENPEILQYAHPALDHGVTVSEEQGTTFVIVPRLKGWRMFCRWEILVLIVCLVRAQAVLSEGYLPLVSAPIAIASLFWLLYTTWRKRGFAVTPYTVKLGYVVSRNYLWLNEWPRKAIGEIRLNRYSGKLLIRVTDQDMNEHFISKNKQVTEYVANALQTALKIAAG